MSGQTATCHAEDEPYAGRDRHAPGAVDGASVMVDGHPVRYLAAGSGPSALFLHGWGLDPGAYREAVRAMGAAGCRVVAPALPGFGGTADLPPGQRSFGGYAAWTARFLDATGVGQVALAAGHSFGGGVAAAFASQAPERVGGLLLANAVGSPTWAAFPNEVRTMMQRPLWDWGRNFGADLLQSPRTLRVLPVVAGSFLPNLVRNPLGLLRTSAFIRQADLVAEVRSVARHRIPVVVAWSDRDGLVPRSAYDELRRAARADGVVVEGSHSWLLADPRTFGELATRVLVDSGVLPVRAPLRLL
jgi:pimeloyl-ACP methyl ester carboxylesterase